MYCGALPFRLHGLTFVAIYTPYTILSLIDYNNVLLYYIMSYCIICAYGVVAETAFASVEQLID